MSVEKGQQDCTSSHLSRGAVRERYSASSPIETERLHNDDDGDDDGGDDDD